MVNSLANQCLSILLPARCLLCSANGVHDKDLCDACRSDLQHNLLACARCALPLEQNAGLCGHCLKREPPFTSAFVPFCYSPPLDQLERRFKFAGDLAAGRLLAQLFIERYSQQHSAMPSLLIPVPLHMSRLRARGYNQALELARPIARQFGIPLNSQILQRIRATPAQTGLDARVRRRNLRDAFNVTTHASLPSHIALFDDVMTTGSTLRECALALQRAGAQCVSVWAIARVLPTRAALF